MFKSIKEIKIINYKVNIAKKCLAALTMFIKIMRRMSVVSGWTKRKFALFYVLKLSAHDRSLVDINCD